MREIRVNDIIEVPAGADLQRRQRYTLRVVEAETVSADVDHQRVHGVVINATGQERRNRNGSEYMRTAVVNRNACELISRTVGPAEVETSPVTVRRVDTELVDCDGRPIGIGYRVMCIGERNAVMTGRQAVVVGFTNSGRLQLDLVHGDVSDGRPPVGRSPERVRVLPPAGMTELLHAEAMTEDATRAGLPETRKSRYGTVAVTYRFGCAPGAYIEICSATGIETAVSAPGTHRRGEVKAQLGNELHWYRVIDGVLHSFTRVEMPDGEIRFSVRCHNGYSDLRFSCAWWRAWFGAFQPPAVPAEILCPAHGLVPAGAGGACPTCDAEPATAAELVDALNAHKGDAWQGVILKSSLFDEDATAAADPSGASDVVVLTDGTVIRHDSLRGIWFKEPTIERSTCQHDGRPIERPAGREAWHHSDRNQGRICFYGHGRPEVATPLPAPEVDADVIGVPVAVDWTRFLISAQGVDSNALHDPDTGAVVATIQLQGDAYRVTLDDGTVVVPLVFGSPAQETFGHAVRRAEAACNGGNPDREPAEDGDKSRRGFRCGDMVTITPEPLPGHVYEVMAVELEFIKVDPRHPGDQRDPFWMIDTFTAYAMCGADSSSAPHAFRIDDQVPDADGYTEWETCSKPYNDPAHIEG